MRKSFVCFIILGLGVLATGGAGFAFAQAEVVNPHGDMDVSCVVCHTEQSWQIDGQPETFDHSSTGFVLEGLHKHALCRDCHQEKVFAHVGVSCADCHDDFHRGRLGVACEECHQPHGWIDRSAMQRDHDATALPLVGAHAQVDCDACHSGPVSSQYVGTPSECVFCHQSDFDATINPSHVVAGFGFDCESCHTVFANTWGSGDFRHPESFPLRGGHGGMECSVCHNSGFQGLPVDCYSCHQTEFDNTTDPGHRAAAFPEDCQACHTTSAWEPANWDHDVFFPIYSGDHREEWNSCTDCHEVATDYSLFECINCHEHGRSETDDDHSEVGDYFYSSADCFRCHPTGDE